MHDAQLLREIAAAPESATPYLVYADSLLQRADPHGELIVVQHALESAQGLEAAMLRRREAALFDAHLEEWLGDLLQYRDWLIVRWTRGFIHGLRVRLRRPGHKPLHHVAAIRAVLDTPIASLIVDLRIGPHQDGVLRTQPLLDELATRWPPALRRLHLSDSWSLDLEPLAEARLDELVVQASQLTLWRGAAPAIRSLEIQQASFDARALASDQPVLERLSLACTEPGSLDWLTPARFPRLQRLALTGARDPDTLACELVTHPIVGQLAALELTGVLGGWGRGACTALARRTVLRVNPTSVQDPAPEDTERAWRRELSPSLRSDGLAIYRTLAEACEQRGDLAMAESWLWQASHHATWYRWSDPYALLDQIATLQLRAGDVTAAAPLRRRVIAGYLHDKPLARGRAFLELGLAELARGRLAHAEADCRTALGIASAEEPLQDALLALLWARDDVESTARGAWLFALYQLDRAADRASELVYSGVPDLIIARSCTLFEQRDAPRGAILVRTLLAELAMRRNNHTRAEHHLAHVLPCASDNERAIALGVMARIAIARADYPAAHRVAAEACELHHACEHRFGAAMQFTTMADAALGEGRHRDVRQHARDALALLVPDDEYPAIASVRLRLGHAAQLQGRRDEAEHHYTAAIVDAHRDRHLEDDREPKRVPRREPNLVGIAETWLAVLRAQDARPAEAYALLGRARDKLPRSGDAASETLAMATRVVARFAGSDVPLSAATRLAPRLISSLLV
ncbi:MAG: TIGR02996 domain-containing protein [Kofleriaceae bacterium]